MFEYLPLLIKIAQHENEITELKTLMGPTLAEFNKVKTKVLPLMQKLAAELTE